MSDLFRNMADLQRRRVNATQKRGVNEPQVRAVATRVGGWAGAGIGRLLAFVAAVAWVVGSSPPSQAPLAAPPGAFVDALIDGNGDGIYGALGTGGGGSVSVDVVAPVALDLILELQNEGGRADGYTVTWDSIPGWRATVEAGPSPFVSENIPPPNSRFYTFHVDVPAGAAAGEYIYVLDVRSGRDPLVVESVEVRVRVVRGATVVGTVFDDYDHDGVFDPGEPGLGGVAIIDLTTATATVTAADGTYALHVPGGTNAVVSEQNPSGYLSTSPDTVTAGIVNTGDTVRVDFADVPPIRLTPGTTRTSLAGQSVDFAHRIDAGTAGAVKLSALADSGVVTTLLLDENGNGVFDGLDRPLVPMDLDLDPQGGAASVAILLRVLVPASVPTGTLFSIQLVAEQSISGTALISSAGATDAVLVVTGGVLTLAKAVDLTAVVPGDRLTYTITFLNAGTDSVQNVEIIDPISTHVEPVADAFGPGQDVEWVRTGAGTQYLTLDPTDADECEFRPSDRTLRLHFSKNSPYALQPGEQGTLRYRVTVR